MTIDEWVGDKDTFILHTPAGTKQMNKQAMVNWLGPNILECQIDEDGHILNGKGQSSGRWLTDA